MERRKIYIGDHPLVVPEGSAGGEFMELEGERYYRISDFDRMPDFFMSIVSASDQWMFISSNGSLTAGRKNARSSLFPYYPEDKIHDFQGVTGSVTIILADRGEKLVMWEPFSTCCSHLYTIRRNLYKNLTGNRLIFEEINKELSLSFRYGWTSCEKYGFIRNAQILNQAETPVSIEILDGLKNILPSGVDPAMQSGFSNLVDAYKKSELEPGSSLGIFRLSSIPVDTAEPSESLMANTAWQEGLKDPVILLSGRQVDRFRSGYLPETEHEVKGEKGAYLLNARFDLGAGSVKEWNIVAEVDQNAADVAGLLKFLKTGKNIRKELYDDVERGRQNLLRIVASSDALQSSREESGTARHLSNVLFNVMRGGVFEDQYRVRTADFLTFAGAASKGLVKASGELFGPGEEYISYPELISRSVSAGDPDLIRICHEYLPLTFSRRHGDPSRPWNQFSIENRREDGSRSLHYQGNWRDIFQNWEALSFSFPEFVEGMICRFVNASTADGYNPYRITRQGIDWEVPDPNDPWSNIGYWGDHQIIYLLKLLRISRDHHPGYLDQLLSREIFTYANVPYRIKPYSDLVADPHHTIEFNQELEEEILERTGSMGSDGKLLWGADGNIMHVTLAEKLLVPLLTKLSNFVPGAGIWMNTQRPEWNDANNALVGYGVSMVTTYHLRAYLRFCHRLFEKQDTGRFELSEEVAGLLDRIHDIFRDRMNHRDSFADGKTARSWMDALGRAGSDYRERYYGKGLSGHKEAVRTEEILGFFSTALQVVDLTIAASRREDKLFHSYNLINLKKKGRVELRRLYEMLEGQVAVLDSGFLSGEESVEILDALRASSLFREDQHSYILYPDRRLPSFLEKNHIPQKMVDRSGLLKLLADKNHRKIVLKDVDGGYHFAGNIRNAGILKEELEKLSPEYPELVEKEKSIILDIYEEVFDHRSFTGRSGTFYGYEGLGSIYWHMVSKLLLAVCDTCHRALMDNEDRMVLEKLASHYYDIRKGIGQNKDPELCGAFPVDPYSHTPGGRGAQQPGMTGQVKEDIIARWGELGILVRDGRLHFVPLLLRNSEFHREPYEFHYFDTGGNSQRLELEPGTLAFTYCQVPVIYRLSAEREIILTFSDGRSRIFPGEILDEKHTASVFQRNGNITRIEVRLEPLFFENS